MTTVAHFPPFDTLDATPDKTEQSGSCSGLGCDPTDIDAYREADHDATKANR